MEQPAGGDSDLAAAVGGHHHHAVVEAVNDVEVAVRPQGRPDGAGEAGGVHGDLRTSVPRHSYDPVVARVGDVEVPRGVQRHPGRAGQAVGRDRDRTAAGRQSQHGVVGVVGDLQGRRTVRRRVPVRRPGRGGGDRRRAQQQCRRQHREPPTRPPPDRLRGVRPRPAGRPGRRRGCYEMAHEVRTCSGRAAAVVRARGVSGGSWSGARRGPALIRRTRPLGRRRPPSGIAPADPAAPRPGGSVGRPNGPGRLRRTREVLRRRGGRPRRHGRGRRASCAAHRTRPCRTTGRSTTVPGRRRPSGTPEPRRP